MRIDNHPILGESKKGREFKINVDGKEVIAYEGEMIATALVASGLKVFRYTSKYNERTIISLNYICQAEIFILNY